MTRSEIWGINNSVYDCPNRSECEDLEDDFEED